MVVLFCGCVIFYLHIPVVFRLHGLLMQHGLISGLPSLRIGPLGVWNDTLIIACPMRFHLNPEVIQVNEANVYLASEKITKPCLLPLNM